LWLYAFLKTPVPVVRMSHLSGGGGGGNIVINNITKYFEIQFSQKY